MLISLCETVTTCWEKISEAFDDENLMGKIVVVLESNRKIDELSIEKEDSKIILYVDQLKF
jgi:hypothetical protein